MTEDFRSAIKLAQIVGIVVLVATALTFSAGCISTLTQKTGDYPDFGYSYTNPDNALIESTFEFQNHDITIKYHVDKNLYNTAKNSDKQTHVPADTPYDEYSSKHFKAFIENEHMYNVYEAILYGLRDIRDRLSLDDDEYAELITAYVQSIPYITIYGGCKYPIETVYDNAGDCDDKTILLTGLLSKEGYDVAFFEFDTHAMTGIKTYPVELGHDNTGYSIIETTEPTLIGWYNNNPKCLEPEYLIVPFNDGEGKSYSSENQVKEIYETFWEASKNCDTIYNLLIDDNNGLSASEFYTKKNEFYYYSDIVNTTIERAGDRPGLYEYINSIEID